MGVCVNCLSGLGLIILLISIYMAMLIQNSQLVVPISTKPHHPLHQQLQVNNITIGYAEHGNVNGKNVIISFHGLPSSRLEFANLFDDIFGDMDTSTLRLISIDRPGCGLSSYYDYNPLLFAQNVLLFADELRIDKFLILGTSGGGPYALAAAVAIPHSRLFGIICLVGIAPINEFKHSLNGMQIGGKILFSLPPYIGAFFLYLNAMTMDENASISNSDFPDKEILSKYPQFVRGIIINMKTAFNNGIAAVLKDLYIIHNYNEWGFNIQQICDIGKDIQIYCLHGVHDENVPISHSFWLQNQTNNECANVKFIRQLNRSHFSMILGNKVLSNTINGLLHL